MRLPELWQSIEADLVRARDTLPQSVQNDNSIRRYQEYIENNELELACDMLASFGESNPVSKQFWLALCDAATKMELQHQASLYEERGKSP